MARFGARGKTAEQLDSVLNPIRNAAMQEGDLREFRRGFFKVLKSIQVGTVFSFSDQFMK